MRARVCKNCGRFTQVRSWCDRFGKFVSPWNDWCEPRAQEYDEWILAEPNIGEGKL